MSSNTPHLAEVIEGAIETYLERHYTMLPGVIVSYDKDSGTATVHPQVHQQYVTEDGQTVSAPIPPIPGVVVLFPGGADGTRITFPLKKGTGVALLFSSVALDRWKLSGVNTDPGTSRRNALPDAVCIPGLFSPSSLPHSEDEIEDATQLHGVEVYVGGKDTDMVYLGDPSATDVVATTKSVGDALSNLLTDPAVATAFLAYATAPSIPASLATLESALASHFLARPVQGAKKVKAK